MHAHNPTEPLTRVVVQLILNALEVPPGGLLAVRVDLSSTTRSVCNDAMQLGVSVVTETVHVQSQVGVGGAGDGDTGAGDAPGDGEGGGLGEGDGEGVKQVGSVGAATLITAAAVRGTASPVSNVVMLNVQHSQACCGAGSSWHSTVEQNALQPAQPLPNSLCKAPE